MKTGDTVRDPQGRAYSIGQHLGRGLWGSCFAAREDGGGEFVLKVPLAAAQLGEGGERLARICQEIAVEQAQILQGQPPPGLVALHSFFRTAEGTPVLVLNRYPASLDRRFTAGCSFDEVMRAAVDVTKILRTLAAPHGLIKPSNVLLTDRGEIRLSDPVTATQRKHLGALLRAHPPSAPWLAPELRSGSEDPPFSTAADSYSVAMLIYRAVLSEPGATAAPALPEAGLDKAALVSLKDRVHNRLKGEPSNARFHTRLSDRVSALLNRALSRESQPSPPFRFARLDELQPRLEEVAALIHPSVTTVGKLLLERPPGADSFTTDETVSFSCTIACSAGVENHEEIAAGIALFDQEREERLRSVACSYTVDRHPSGRFRFGFKVTDLTPGTYRVRTAFTIRDSGHEPATAESRFTIRPAPGYVPPRAEPESRPLQIERAENTAITERKPSPIAPPAPPDDEEVEVTQQPLRARPAPVVQLHPRPRNEPPPPDVFNEEEEDEDDAYDPDTSPSEPARQPRPAYEEEEDDEPEYRGAGRWTDLPVPGLSTGRDDEEVDDGYDGEPETSGTSSPLMEPINRLMELARGEAYWLYVAGAVGIIVVLFLILMALR